MAHAKETPRQKLIGMMYLVLTAMLALNVSKEVLNGYTAVNDTVVSSNGDFTEKQKTAFDSFLKEFTMNKIEVEPFWNKAKVASKLSSDMSKYIKDFRDELISITEKVPMDSARNLSMEDMRKKDNYTIPTAFLIGPLENGSKGKARELKQKIAEFRKKISGLVQPSTRKNLSLGLGTDDDFKDAFGKKETWERHYFYDLPLAADIPILNKFITEVNSAELEVVNALLRESIAEDFKYDRIEAKVLPKSNYIFSGEDYEAEVIVAAYDTSHSPKPSVYLMRGVDSLSSDQRANAMQVKTEKGRLNIKFPANELGLQKYAGFVSVPTSSGREKMYHFNSEFFVAIPSMTISPTYMNVLYVGVDNPMSISVTGIPKENLIPSISIGEIKQSRATGEWVAVIPNGAKEAIVSVSVKTSNGIKQMGSFKFRIKKLPDPTPTIANKKGGFLTKESILGAGQIIASMPPEFEFNFNFKILSFKLIMERGFETYTYESNNENLTDEMIQQIQRTNRGQILTFENIIALGPSNEKRELPSFYITVK